MAIGFLQNLLDPYRLEEEEAEPSFASPDPFSQDPIYASLFGLLEPPGGGGSDKRGGGNNGGGRGGPVNTAGLGNIQAMVKRMADKRGWDGGQWKALNELVSRESSWNPKADNPTSTAYGLFQFLDSTRANYGLPLNAGPKKQAKAGLKYIADRYKNPKAAIKFHNAQGWY